MSLASYGQPPRGECMTCPQWPKVYVLHENLAFRERNPNSNRYFFIKVFTSKMWCNQQGSSMVFFRGWGVGAGRAAGRCISRAAVTMGLAGAMEVQKDPGRGWPGQSNQGIYILNWRGSWTTFHFLERKVTILLIDDTYFFVDDHDDQSDWPCICSMVIHHYQLLVTIRSWDTYSIGIEDIEISDLDYLQKLRDWHRIWQLQTLPLSHLLKNKKSLFKADKLQYHTTFLP